MPRQSKKKAAPASGRKEEWNAVGDWYSHEAVLSGAESSEASNGNRNNEKGKRIARVEPNALQLAMAIDGQPSFGNDPFAQAIQDAKPAFKAILNLGDQYAKHVENVKNMHSVLEERDELRSDCDSKTVEIEQLKMAVRALERMRGDQEEEFRQQSESIVQVRKGLDDEKEKFERKKAHEEKRLVAESAELKLTQQKTLEELKKKQNEQFAKREAELEKANKNERAELEGQLKKLLDAIKHLQAKLASQEKAMAELQSQLKNEKDKCDEQIRVKESFKEDRDRLQKELSELKNEFSMDGKSPEFYQTRFRELSELVEIIATKQVDELDEDGADKLKELLKSTNSPFQFMPISDSDESKKLLSAFFQFNISSILRQAIWQPFSSEKTFANHQLTSNLEEMVNALASFGNRKGRMLKTLINQSLQQTWSARPPNPSSPTARTSSISSRAQYAVEEILKLVSWHTDPKKSEITRKDVQMLVDAAISVWNYAQVDQLDISGSSILDPKLREQWTSSKLEDMADSKTMLKADSVIFNLFPCFIAVLPPTLFIKATENEIEPKTILIHPGRGLPAESRLVALGTQEKCVSQRILDEEMKQARERASSRINHDVSQSRRGSTASRNSGVPGAISQWRSQGGMKEVEE